MRKVAIGVGEEERMKKVAIGNLVINIYIILPDEIDCEYLVMSTNYSYGGVGELQKRVVKRVRKEW
mgnify:CR=1 FL=1